MNRMNKDTENLLLNRIRTPYPDLFTCPFFDIKNKMCLASISPMTVGKDKVIISCGSEDYEKCPIFLCKILRSSQPKYRGVPDLYQK